MEKQVGSSFILKLITKPEQYGLASDLIIRKFTYLSGNTVPSTITADCTISEIMGEAITDYTETITVSANAYADHDLFAYAGNISDELAVDDIISIGSEVGKIKSVTTELDGTGYIKLTTPLKNDVTSGAEIHKESNTGEYRIDITENFEGQYSYQVSCNAANPDIKQSTAVIDIVDEESEELIVDNSQLLL